MKYTGKEGGEEIMLNRYYNNKNQHPEDIKREIEIYTFRIMKLLQQQPDSSRHPKIIFDVLKEF
jgi:hypothetical protein